MSNTSVNIVVSLISLLLFTIFFICISVIGKFGDYKYGSLELWGSFGGVSLVLSFVTAFATALYWKTYDRDTKAFALIFVALFFGIIMPSYLYPMFEVEKSVIVFYIFLIKEISVFSCAGAAGGLFAMSAESHIQNRHKDLVTTGCNAENSRKEIIKLTDKISVLRRFVVIGVLLQITTAGLVLYGI